MGMNRKQLLSAIGAQGYSEEAPTLDSVKSFSESNNLQFVYDNEKVDIAKAWDTPATVSIDAPEVKQRVKPATKDSVKAMSQDMESVRNEDVSKQRAPQPFFIGNVQKSMFQQKIDRGQTFLKDADIAEYVGASFRVSAMQTNGVESWASKSRDMEILKSINTYDNAPGGYLVPPAELMQELIYNGEPTGVARQVARVVKIGGSGTSFARETADVTMSAVGEGQAIPDANPAYGRVNLYARKSGIVFTATSEELEDSTFAIGESLTRKATIAYDNRVDDDYILGDGTSTYNQFTGLANAGTNVTSSNASGNAWSAVVAADIFGAVGKLQGCGSNIRGICSRNFAMTVLANLEVATSQFKTLFRMNPDQRGGVFAESLPIHFSQRMPTASASGSKFMYVGNFMEGTMVGEKRDLQIIADRSSGLSTDVFKWYVTARYSVNIHGHGRTDLTNQNLVAITTT